MNTKIRKIVLFTLGIFLIVFGFIGNVANNWKDFWIGLIFIIGGICLIVKSSKISELTIDIRDNKNDGSKKCKYCMSKIDNKARICPHCRKHQGSSVLRAFVGVIIGLFILGVMSYNYLHNFDTDDTKCSITLSEFNRIENGMSYDDLVEIIGCNGTLSTESSYGDSTMKVYYWYAHNEISNATFSFLNDELTAKSQIGLD